MMSQDNNNNYQFQPDGYTFWSDTQSSQSSSEMSGKSTSSAQQSQPLSQSAPLAQRTPSTQQPELPKLEQPAPLGHQASSSSNSSQFPQYASGIQYGSPLGSTEGVCAGEPQLPVTKFWTYDIDGSVSSFTDQDGICWKAFKKLETGCLYKSTDGGERVAKVSIQNNACVIEDADGSVTTIGLDGKSHITHSAKSKENEIRSLLSVFMKVDTNGDQRLSLEELDIALKSDRHKESEKELIRSLKTQFSRINWTKREMFGESSDGISLKDIVDVKGPKERLGNEINETLVSYIEEVLDRVDQRIYGNIDPQTFSHVASTLRMPERLRFSIDVLLKRLNELNLYKGNGFDSLKWRPSRSAVRLMLCDVFKQFPELDNDEKADWVTQEVQATDYTLFAEGEAIKSIVPEAVRNCLEANQTFMAVVAAIVTHNPMFIIGSIKPCGDSAFVVTFPGDKSLPVRVMAPTHKEICQYGLAKRFGIWALVIGKAFNEYAKLKHKTELDDVLEIAQLFSSQPVSSFDLANSSPEDLEAGVKELWFQKSFMMLGRFPKSGQEELDSVLHHSFAVTDFDLHSVTLHNPDWDRAVADCPKLSVTTSRLSEAFDVLIYG